MTVNNVWPPELQTHHHRPELCLQRPWVGILRRKIRDHVAGVVGAMVAETPDWASVTGVPYIARIASGLQRPAEPVCGFGCSLQAP